MAAARLNPMFLETSRDPKRSTGRDRCRSRSDFHACVSLCQRPSDANGTSSGPDRLRAHHADAALDRADLTSKGRLKGAFGTHCFRRSFVTRTRALGKNEDSVRQRTGHTSDELLTYRQAAKSLAELELDDVDPLDQALPICPRCLLLPVHLAGAIDPRANGRGGRIRTCDP